MISLLFGLLFLIVFLPLVFYFVEVALKLLFVVIIIGFLRALFQ